MGATYDAGNVKSRQFCWLWRLVIYKSYVSEGRAASVFRVEDICRTYLPPFGSYIQITLYHLSQHSKLVATAGLMAHLTAFFSSSSKLGQFLQVPGTWRALLWLATGRHRLRPIQNTRADKSNVVRSGDMGAHSVWVSH